MANQKTSIITNEGLNAANQFGIFGSHFAMLYFLPMYDPRIDNEIHTKTQEDTDGLGTNVMVLSASFSPTDTFDIIKGERLYNQNSSDLQAFVNASDSDIYSVTTRSHVICASPGGVEGGDDHTDFPTPTIGVSVVNTSQNVNARINRIAGFSISDVWSATDLVADGLGDFTGTIAEGTAATLPAFALDGTGKNTSATAMLYAVESFVPIDVSGSDPSVDAGQYNLRLEAPVGRFRFNKVVLFISRVNADGSEDKNFLPVPFSEMVFEGTITKDKTTAFGNNVTWEANIQLVFQRDSTSNNLTTLQVQNWAHSTSAFGLNTSNSVSIFDTNRAGSFNPSAKLQVTDSTGPQFRLAEHHTSAFGEISVSADARMHIFTSAGVSIKTSAVGEMGTSANDSGNEFTIENPNGHAGMTIFSDDDDTGNIFFADHSNNNSGRILFNHDDNGSMTLQSGGAGTMAISGGPTVFDEPRVSIGTIGGVGVQGTLHIAAEGPSSTISDLPAAEHRGVIIEDGLGSGTGLSIISDAKSNIIFGDATDADVGRIIYDHSLSNNEMQFYTDATLNFTITDQGISATTNTLAIKSPGTSVVIGDHADADNLVIRANGQAGINILSTTTGNIYFGDNETNLDAWIQYNHTSTPPRLGFAASGQEMMRLIPFPTGSLTVALSAAGTTNPLGTLYVYSGASGGATPNINADDLVISNNGNAGISIITPGATASGYLYFGDEASSNVGGIQYNHTTSPNQLVLRSGGADKVRIVNDGSGTMMIGDSGVALQAPTGTLMLVTGALIPPTPNTGADGLIIQGSASTGMTINTANTSIGNIFFGNTGSATQGRFYYDHASDDMSFHVADSSTAGMKLFSSNQVMINQSGGPTSTPRGTLHVKRSSFTDPAASTSADALVIEAGTHTGISIFSATAGYILFGDTADESSGRIIYNHSGSSNIMSLFTNGEEHGLQILSDGLINFVNGGTVSTKSPETDPEDDWLEIQLNGVQRFIPLYAIS